MPRIPYAVIAVLIALAMSVAACGGAEPAPVDENGLGLADGTYEGNSDANRQGYVWVEVTVSDGEITDVAMKEFRGDGTEKTSDNYDYDEWFQAVEELPQAVVDEQSADVDAVAGATGTSEKFKQAVRRALGEEDEETGPYADGDHTGYSDPGPRGYVSARVVVQRGTITHVELREFQGDGTEKTPETYDYEEWAEAAEDLPWAVLEEQSANVDVVAGATSTSNKFMQAVRRALGEEAAFDMGPYEDGTYVGRSDETERGDWVEAEVNILLGTIVAVSMEEYRADGEPKSPETYDYEPWVEAAEALPQAVVDAQSADVDAVAGATSTSNLFIQAVERALEDAS